MKVLLIFTGGTIGSTISNNYISLDGTKSSTLLKKYEEKYGIDFEFDTLTPYNELSENNTSKTLNLLTHSVKEAYNNQASGKSLVNNRGIPIFCSSSYDGIIITHGTDSLAYSAAALYYSMGTNLKYPVCFVSSDKPIEDETANGLSNLHAAIGIIRESLKHKSDPTSHTAKSLNQVLVVYKNANSRTYIHAGNRLELTRLYNPDFYSTKDEVVGEVNNDDILINSDFVTEDNAPANIDFVKQFSLIIPCVLSPGIDYRRLSAWLTSAGYLAQKAIVMRTYHSGTINTKDQAARDFYLNMKNLGIKVYLAGGYCKEVLSYESTKDFEKLGITPLCKLDLPGALSYLARELTNNGDYYEY